MSQSRTSPAIFGLLAALLMVAALITLKVAITAGIQVFTSTFTDQTLLSFFGNGVIGAGLAWGAWALGKKARATPEEEPVTENEESSEPN